MSKEQSFRRAREVGKELETMLLGAGFDPKMMQQRYTPGMLFLAAKVASKIELQYTKSIDQDGISLNVDLCFDPTLEDMTDSFGISWKIKHDHNDESWTAFFDCPHEDPVTKHIDPVAQNFMDAWDDNLNLSPEHGLKRVLAILNFAASLKS
ncbi:MAG TPA: hypothetical protein PLK06_00705 [bacterium]|nr:hypothetical protein [bacterium]